MGLSIKIILRHSTQECGCKITKKMETIATIRPTIISYHRVMSLKYIILPKKIDKEIVSLFFLLPLQN